MALKGCWHVLNKYHTSNPSYLVTFSCTSSVSPHHKKGATVLFTNISYGFLPNDISLHNSVLTLHMRMVLLSHTEIKIPWELHISIHTRREFEFQVMLFNKNALFQEFSVMNTTHPQNHK